MAICSRPDLPEISERKSSSSASISGSTRSASRNSFSPAADNFSGLDRRTNNSMPA